MAEFRYTALDEQGREVTGALQAEDRASALARLKSMGMYPMGLELGGGGSAAVTGAFLQPRAASARAIAPIVIAVLIAVLTRILPPPRDSSSAQSRGRPESGESLDRYIFLYTFR